MKEVYLVTGASRGIGRSLSLELVNSGFTVIGLSRQSTELDLLEDELKLIDSNSTTIACDIASTKE